MQAEAEGRVDRAENMLRDAIHQGLDSQQLRLQLGEIEYQTGQIARSHEDWNAGQVGPLLIDAAQRWAEDGYRADAEEYLTRAAIADPVVGNLALGDFLWGNGDQSNAVAAYLAALQMGEAATPATLTAAARVAESEQRWDDAVSAYKASLDLRPNDPDVLAHLGGVLFARGNVREAESVLNTALAMDSKQGLAACVMAAVQSQRGEITASIASRAQAVASGWPCPGSGAS
jgi:tetratricopeptide (TPR) repeat protein